MEINNNINKDELIEFPDNFEEIANLALLNFEKTSKIDLNKLVQIGLEKEKKIINEFNIKKDENYEKQENFEDFGDDDDNDDNEENQNYNKYQRFEDEEFLENEEHDKLNEKPNNNKKEEIINNNIFNINIVENLNEKEKKDCIKNEELLNGKKVNLQEKKIIKKKLSNEELKNLISKIEYTPPDWAKNLSDQEFINKVKLFINNKKV